MRNQDLNQWEERVVFVDMVLKGGLTIMQILLSDTKRGSTLGPNEQMRPSSFRKQRRDM